MNNNQDTKIVYEGECTKVYIDNTVKFHEHEWCYDFDKFLPFFSRGGDNPMGLSSLNVLEGVLNKYVPRSQRKSVKQVLINHMMEDQCIVIESDKIKFLIYGYHAYQEIPKIQENLQESALNRTLNLFKTK